MSTQEVIKDPRHKRLTVSRTLDVPRDTVWQAWTDGAALEKWWAPEKWATTTKSFDFREGGHWHFSMTGPNGRQVWVWFAYKNVDPPHSFTATDTFCDQNGNLKEEISTWQVEFEPIGDEQTKLTTTLQFASLTNMDRTIAMGFETGYTEQIDKLERYFERKEQQ